MDARTERLARKIRELRELYAVLETVLSCWGPDSIRALRLEVERRESERLSRAA